MPPGAHAKLLQERLHSVAVPRYTDLYDGLLLFNPRTMFAVRLSYATMVYLTPLLKHHQPMDEFLAVRAIQGCLADHTQPSVDHARGAQVCDATRPRNAVLVQVADTGRRG